MSVAPFYSSLLTPPKTYLVAAGGCALVVGGIFMLLAGLQVLPQSVNVLSNMGGQIGGAALISSGTLTLGVLIAKCHRSPRSQANRAGVIIQHSPLADTPSDHNVTERKSPTAIASPCNFEGIIPAELISTIFERCSREEWLKARTVCSEWRTLADRMLIKHIFEEHLAQKLFSLSGDWSHLAANLMASAITKSETHKYSLVGSRSLLMSLLARDPIAVSDFLRLGVNPMSKVRDEKGDEKSLIVHFIASYDINADRDNPRFLYILFLLLRFSGNQTANIYLLAEISMALLRRSCTEGLKLLMKLNLFSIEKLPSWSWRRIMKKAFKRKNLSLFKFIHKNEIYDLKKWRSYLGRTLLHECVEYEAEEIELYLIKVGVPTDVRDDSGETYLELKERLVNQKNCCAIVSYLLSSERETTPVESQLEYLESIIAQCTDLNATIISEDTLLTAVMASIRWCDDFPEQQIILLIKHGADPHKKGVDNSAYEYLEETHKILSHPGGGWEKRQAVLEFMKYYKKVEDVNFFYSAPTLASEDRVARSGFQPHLLPCRPQKGGLD